MGGVDRLSRSLQEAAQEKVFWQVEKWRGLGMGLEEFWLLAKSQGRVISEWEQQEMDEEVLGAKMQGCM